MREILTGMAALVAAFPLLTLRGQCAPDAAGEFAQERNQAGALVEARRDPATGVGWQLLRGVAGGPGRWIQKFDSFGTPKEEAKPNAPVVIRAGDRLLVTEETSMASMQMLVVALEPARLGATLRVRTMAGNRMLFAVALGKGRAALVASRWGER
ncbi:MAG: hypothetical protein ACLGPM_01670 [Acidobacteriota bacterium]